MTAQTMQHRLPHRMHNRLAIRLRPARIATRLSSIVLPVIITLILAPGTILAGPILFENVPLADSVIDKHIIAILQDSHGFMWFGTRNALLRYDGYNFHSYIHDPRDSSSIGNGGIICLFEDSHANIWVGCGGGGLNRFERHTETFVHYSFGPGSSEKLQNAYIYSICEDRYGDIWFSTLNLQYNLARVRPGSTIVERFVHDPDNPWSLGTNLVSAVTTDQNGELWVCGFRDSFNYYDRANKRFINERNQPAFDILNGLRLADHMVFVPDGPLIVAGAPYILRIELNKGRINQTARASMKYIDGADDAHCAIRYTDNGRVWLGNWRTGLEVLDLQSNTTRNFRHDPCNPNSINGDQVFAIYEDRTGDIWLGTNNGINKVKKLSNYFQSYIHTPEDDGSISYNRIRSIALSKNGTLYIGTGGRGLDVRFPASEKFQNFSYSTDDYHALGANTINTLLIDRHGRLWAGSNQGLYRYSDHGKVLASFVANPKDSSGIPPMGVWSLLEEDDKHLWVGTLGAGLGLINHQSGKSRNFVHEADKSNSLPNNLVLCLHRDRKGRMWVGTEGGISLYLPESQTFRTFSSDPGDSTTLSNNRIWYIHEDSAGIFWIATSGGGINRFDPASGICKRYTSKQGLVHNFACAILEDEHENLWISTFGGLSRFNKRTEEFRTYTSDDGINIKEYHFKTACKAPGGYMYFGGLGGLIYFHPDSIPEDNIQPNVVISSVRLFDKELQTDTAIYLKKRIDLQHDENSISFSFAALDYTNPVRNRYRYMLVNYDKAWRHCDGRQPHAGYTKIEPGDYIFTVMTSGTGGNPNTNSATLHIHIEPAYYQTLWFKSLVGAVLGALLLWAVLARITNVRNKERLNRKLVEYRLQSLRAQMNPHFIFNSLNSILNFVARNDSDAAHVYLSKFSKLMRLVLESSKNEVITMEEDFAALRYYLELECLRHRGRFEYSITIDPSIPSLSTAVPPLLIQPYVENAVKHGLAHLPSGGKLNIIVERYRTEIRCSVIDNGIGRQRAAELQSHILKTYKSRGMEVTRERMHTLTTVYKETYRVEVRDLYTDTGEAAGTQVDIYIPQITFQPDTA